MPPETPVGVKLELTHLCNLKCPFCYTDSPRHTRAKSADLTDDEWRAIVADAIETGVVEAVVTGGEPLLRKDLALELLDTLARAGVGATMNTNGWFVDDAVADRLAAVEGLQVNISLDGATPELHDGARGGAGSWARAVGAADRLLARGVRVRLIHVVTPTNVGHIDSVLEHGWLLGVRSMRVTRVGMFGAAARGGAWDVDSGTLYAAVDGFRARRGRGMPLNVNTASAAGLAAVEDVAPAALLVRPSGAVLIDSLKPFRFGTAPEESLQECWDRIASTWPHPAVVEWAHGIHTSAGIGQSDHVPYRDDEVEIVAAREHRAAGREVSETKIPTIATPLAVPVDLDGARRTIVGLALARRYRQSRVRFTGAGARGRFVRVAADGRTFRLNETAARVMDACDGGTPAAAVELLVGRHPQVSRAAVEADVLASVRSLLERNVIQPALA
jgi:MoaA/NifB/PqqE/SkfB family radical SAM enzyme